MRESQNETGSRGSSVLASILLVALAGVGSTFSSDFGARENQLAVSPIATLGTTPTSAYTAESKGIVSENLKEEPVTFNGVAYVVNYACELRGDFNKIKELTQSQGCRPGFEYSILQEGAITIAKPTVDLLYDCEKQGRNLSVNYDKRCASGPALRSCVPATFVSRDTCPIRYCGGNLGCDYVGEVPAGKAIDVEQARIDYLTRKLAEPNANKQNILEQVGIPSGQQDAIINAFDQEAIAKNALDAYAAQRAEIAKKISGYAGCPDYLCTEIQTLVKTDASLARDQQAITLQAKSLENDIQRLLAGESPDAVAVMGGSENLPSRLDFAKVGGSTFSLTPTVGTNVPRPKNLFEVAFGENDPGSVPSPTREFGEGALDTVKKAGLAVDQGLRNASDFLNEKVQTVAGAATEWGQETYCEFIGWGCSAANASQPKEGTLVNTSNRGLVRLDDYHKYQIDDEETGVVTVPATEEKTGQAFEYTIPRSAVPACSGYFASAECRTEVEKVVRGALDLSVPSPTAIQSQPPRVSRFDNELPFTTTADIPWESVKTASTRSLAPSIGSPQTIIEQTEPYSHGMIGSPEAQPSLRPTIPAEFGAMRALDENASLRDQIQAIGSYQQRKNDIVPRYFAEELPNYSGTAAENAKLVELVAKYEGPALGEPSYVRAIPDTASSEYVRINSAVGNPDVGDSIVEFCKAAFGDNAACSSNGADRLRLVNAVQFTNYTPTGGNNLEVLRRLREQFK